MTDRPKIEGTEVIVMSPTPADATAPGVLGVPVPPGYTNHIGSGRDGAGNIFWAVTVDGPSSGDVDVAIMRRDVATAVWQEIWRFDERTYGKHGYGTLQPLPDGSLSCGLAERNSAGQTVAIERIVPAEYARAVWAGASGGFVCAPSGAIRVLDGKTGFEGQQTIPLAPLGVPSHVSALSVRVCASASSANRRGRAGPNTASSGAAMVTVATQAPNVRIYSGGVVGPGPDNTLVIWADNGPLAEFFIDVLGWWP